MNIQEITKKIKDHKGEIICDIYTDFKGEKEFSICLDSVNRLKEKERTVYKIIAIPKNIRIETADLYDFDGKKYTTYIAGKTIYTGNKKGLKSLADTIRQLPKKEEYYLNTIKIEMYIKTA